MCAVSLVLVDLIFSLGNVGNECLLEGYSKIVETIIYLQSFRELVKPGGNIMRSFR